MSGWGLWVLLGLLIAGCTTVPPPEKASWILSTYPQNGESGVSPYTLLEIRFSHPMDPETARGFTLRGPRGEVQGEPQWVDPTRLRFLPAQPLEPHTTYQAILSAGKTREGIPLEGVPYIWVFTTGQ